MANYLYTTGLMILSFLASSAFGQIGYDSSGNTVVDVAKGLERVQYNVLNLPDTIVVRNKGYIAYSYLATGEKVSSVSVDATGKQTLHSYVDGIEYGANNQLQWVATEAGRLVPNASGFKPEYFISDHLGNNRVVFDEGGLVQTTGYYPYGGLQSGGALQGGTQANSYLYNGIEREENLGVDVYTAFYRTLDPRMSRWWQVDPKAEMAYSWSPYNLNQGNPVLYNDPKGDVAQIALGLVAAYAAFEGASSVADVENAIDDLFFNKKATNWDKGLAVATVGFGIFLPGPGSAYKKAIKEGAENGYRIIGIAKDAKFVEEAGVTIVQHADDLKGALPYIDEVVAAGENSRAILHEAAEQVLDAANNLTDTRKKLAEIKKFPALARMLEDEVAKDFGQGLQVAYKKLDEAVAQGRISYTKAESIRKAIVKTARQEISKTNDAVTEIYSDLVGHALEHWK